MTTIILLSNKVVVIMNRTSAIEELFFNNCGIDESLKCKKAEYLTSLDKVIEREENLLEKLRKTPAIFDLYQNFQIEQRKLQEEERKSLYEQAFKFGIILGLEIAGFWCK